MYATLLTAILLAQAPQAGTQPPGRDTQPSARSLDGTWTVLCFEKNGQAVPEAKNMTITIRNNVATCSGDEKNRPKSMRLEFGQNGTIRVTELDAAAGAPGAAAPGAAPTARTEGAAGEHAGAKTGHYILTKDFFCVCLKDGQAAGGGRDVQPGARAGAADTQPGTFSTTVPAGKPDACVVILKKSDGSSTGDRRP